MAIQFVSRPIPFDATAGIIQRESVTVPFTGRVISAEAALKGFDIGFTNGDHNLLRQRVDLDVVHGEHSVTVTASFLLRDASGNIDDPFQGTVECLIIAEVV